MRERVAQKPAASRFAPEPRDEHHRQPGNPGSHRDSDHEVSGNFIRVWATESVMTPVMVPGLRQRISGVSDCIDFESPAAGCLLSMENPIHATLRHLPP